MKKRYNAVVKVFVAVSVSIVFILSACSSNKKVDVEAVQREIRNREPKKISESQIIEKTLNLGSEVALKSQIKLASSLKTALQEGGIQHAIEFCNLNAYPLIDSLQQVYGAEIRRVTFKTRNEEDVPNELERSILEAYEEASKNGVELKDHAQILDDSDYVLYTKPIVINNALCLTCHGKPGETLTEEAQTIIKKHYPKDQATGYEMNDLRGMWSIKMLKQGIVKTL